MKPTSFKVYRCLYLASFLQQIFPNIRKIQRYQERVFHQEGGQALEQTSQGSDHNTEPEFKTMLSDTWSDYLFICVFLVCLEWSFGDTGIGINDPCGSLSTQDILRFCDSMVSQKSLQPFYKNKNEILFHKIMKCIFLYKC